MNIKDIISVLANFSSEVDDLQQIVCLEVPDDVSREDLLELAAAAHSLKASVSLLYSDVQDLVTNRVEFLAEPVKVSKGTIEIKSGSARKAWDHRTLMSVVSRRLVDRGTDIESGEVPMSVEDMVESLFDYVGISYWKVGKLKELGIDADDFCEVQEPKKNLVFRRD